MPRGPLPSTSLRTRIGLTGRGWWFLGSGLAVGTVAVVQGWTPIVQFAALVALLPVVAALLTRAPRSGFTLHRDLSSRELASGDELAVTVSARGRLPRGRSLLIEDLGPAALGGAHRFALNSVPREGVSRSRYLLRVGARGVHHIGPMRLHVIDRFGMVHRVTQIGGRDEVVVHPPVVRLDPRPLSLASAGSGSGHLGARGAATDDVIPREYRPGDEVRRIDWKASARTGDLMVRSEENPWRASATIVIDMHRSSHRGFEPDSSLDAALSVAASVGCLALKSGWNLTVLTTDDTTLFTGSPITGVVVERKALLLALATVPPSPESISAASLGHTTAASSGPLVLVAADARTTGAQSLAGIGSANQTRILVDIAARHWVPTGQEPLANDTSVDAFRLAGWRSVQLDRPGSGPRALTMAVGRAWSRLAVGR